MTTALYRRYRPETFQDVIGQEHVTEPLMTALRKNRVNHAYLFSGPRGCGKTTSARILARCLNCAEGPTATPCGHCDSCRDLARDGAGSLDVIEMDAASHGGVDHARDLRERATFAPVRDRYKIFIIDEAHMVTREGFNALLKIVEEPPEHVKFVFATTEPSKVLTTIRSRTHHYPFRLVPPEPLMHYLERLCDREDVHTEPGVLSLVVRAGGGSVRDSLSVLDQLMAGSDDDGITYDLSVALLGYTHAALLDDVVDAFAAGDAATVFAAVDRVIQTGQDPRRFVEDLLERFRDLVVVNAVPDSAANILHGMPTDQINRLRNQAAQLGAAELSRAADITNAALNEMTGATSPQLHLELLCARILLPSADDTSRGVTARVDRLERRLGIPRGAGIRPSGAETPRSSAEDTAPALPPASPLRSPGPEAAAPAPERPAEDGAGPADPQDEAEAPEGTDHPAASEPVHHPETLPEHGRPPADGRTGRGEPDAARGHESPPRAESDAAAAPRGSGGAGDPQQWDTRQPGAPQSDTPRPDASQGDTEHRDAGRRIPEQHRRQGGPEERTPAADPRSPRSTAPDGDAEDGQSTEAAPEQSRSGDIELLRSSWTEIVAALAEIRRVAWTVIMRGTPVAFDGQTLRIAFEAEGDLLNFPRFENDVRAAIHQVLGIDCRVEAVRPGDVQGHSAGGQDSPGPRTGGPDAPRPATPGGSRGPRPGGPEDERPEYFREPEGFGANRRRAPGAPAARPGQPQRGATTDPRGTPRDDRSAEPEPAPEPDEPVTSWSVAKIPQGTPATPPDHDAARPTAGTPGDESGARTGDEQRPGHREHRSGAAPAGGHVDAAPEGRADGSRSEYWTPPEPPPPPEDEPPADLHEIVEPSAEAPDTGFAAPGHRSASRGGTATMTSAAPAHAAAGGRTTARARPSWRERHAAELAAAQQRSGEPWTAPAADEDFVPSADDESVEDSALHGRAAIERLLGGTLIDERPHPEQ